MQDECQLAKIDIHYRVNGDVVLECIHLDDDHVKEEMMFRVVFHTAFVRGYVLMVGHDEVDHMWDARDQLPKDFKAEVGRRPLIFFLFEIFVYFNKFGRS